MNRIVLKNVFADFFIRKKNSHKIFEIVRFWGELFIVIGEIIFNLLPSEILLLSVGISQSKITAILGKAVKLMKTARTKMLKYFIS